MRPKFFPEFRNSLVNSGIKQGVFFFGWNPAR
jgi:hypothetical protein